MSDDLDCGDCGECFCCDDCGECFCCDDCGCCNCDCFDNCCSGETNVIMCCFLSSDDTSTKRHRTSSATDGHLCCCGRNKKSARSRTTKSSNNKRRGGFCWSLMSCFGRDNSPPSTSNQTQSKLENMPPKTGYNQDGRGPMYGGRSEMSVMDYEERCRRRASWEILDMPPKGRIMDGKWSSPVKHGDCSNGHS